MRDLISLLEAATDMVTLYRGDSSKIDRFELDKTDLGGLFGMGIYLTDSPDVAKDYTVKGSTEVEFRAADHSDPHGAQSPKELITAYLRHLISEDDFTEQEKELRRTWTSKFWNHPLYAEHGNPERQKAMDEYTNEFKAARAKLIRRYVEKAKKDFQKIRPTIRITKLTTGEYVFTKASRTGSVAKFEVPRAYLERCIHGERPMTDEALQAVKDVYVMGGDPDRAFDLRAYDDKGDEKMGLSFDQFVALFKKNGSRYAWAGHTVGGKGKNPSLDNMWNGTHSGYSAFSKVESQKLLITKLTALGYTGLAYDGGVRLAGTGNRGGGGIQHSAYVLWDEHAVNDMRVGDDSVVDDEVGEIHKGIRAKGIA